MQKLELFNKAKDLNSPPPEAEDEKSLQTPMTEKNVRQSDMNPKKLIMSNFYKQNNYVWYAAYDEDMNSNQMLAKLMKINKNKDKDDIDALPMEI